MFVWSMEILNAFRFLNGSSNYHYYNKDFILLLHNISYIATDCSVNVSALSFRLNHKIHEDHTEEKMQ